jgi:prevent-host-death family protein
MARPTITVRDLRNHGGDVLDRVQRGEALTVTRDGTPVARLEPLRPRGLTRALLVDRWRHLPSVDPQRLRADIDEALDVGL